MDGELPHLYIFVVHTYIYTYTGWGKSRFTVVHIENNTIINNNNTRINSVSYTHNYKLLLPDPVYISYIISFNVHINFAKWLFLLLGYRRRNRGSERAGDFSQVQVTEPEFKLRLAGSRDQCLHHFISM